MKDKLEKFQVGDIIEANEYSDKEYTVATKKNGWTGVVVWSKAGTIYAKTITTQAHKGEEYQLNDYFFDLVAKRPKRHHNTLNKAKKIKLAQIEVLEKIKEYAVYNDQWNETVVPVSVISRFITDIVCSGILENS